MKQTVYKPTKYEHLPLREGKYGETHRCKTCARDLPLNQFTRRGKKKDLLNGECRGCNVDRIIKGPPKSLVNDHGIDLKKIAGLPEDVAIV